MVPGIRSALGRRAAYTLIVLLVVLAGATAPVGTVGAAGASQSSAAAADSTDTALSIEIERADSTIRYRATVEPPEDAENARIDGAFDLLHVTETDGLRRTDDGYRLREGREQATLVGSIDLSQPRTTRLGRIGPDGPFQAGDGWAFAPSPRFRLSWTANDTTEERRLAAGGPAGDAGSTTATASIDADRPVAVGDRFVFLGAHTVRESGGENPTRLIVPDAASFEVGADRGLSLAERSYDEAGTDPDGPVTAFVLPREARAGGAASGTDLWVRADASELTVAHEFAHAALSFRTTERTRWLGEGAAEYVAYETAGPDDVTGVLVSRVTQPDAVLADRDSWGSDRVAYRKGAAVLALLDERIRDATDGEQSVRAVLGTLSASSRVDSAVLRESVVDAADESTAAWFSEHVGGESAALEDAADSSAGTETVGLDRRLAGGAAGTNSFSLVELSGLLAALSAVAVLLWTLARFCYRLCARLRSGIDSSAV